MCAWLDAQVWRDSGVGRLARGERFLRGWKLDHAIKHVRDRYLSDIGEPLNSSATSMKEVEKEYFRRLDISKSKGRF